MIGEVELTTVDSRGNVKTRVIERGLNTLYEVARAMLEDIEEVLVEDIMRELNFALYFEKALISEGKDKPYYIVITEFNGWYETRVIRADKALFYNKEVYVTANYDKVFKYPLYMNIKAVYYHDTLYYHIPLNGFDVKTIGDELALLLNLEEREPMMEGEE